MHRDRSPYTIGDLYSVVILPSEHTTVIVYPTLIDCVRMTAIVPIQLMKPHVTDESRVVNHLSPPMTQKHVTMAVLY